MQKKRVRRICAALMCCMLVVFVTCPVVFAAEQAPDLCYVWQFNAGNAVYRELEHGNYYFLFFSPDFDDDTFVNTNYFDVALGSSAYYETCEFMFDGTEAFGFGNFFMADPSYYDNGADFLCGVYEDSSGVWRGILAIETECFINLTSQSQSFAFICTPCVPPTSATVYRTPFTRYAVNIMDDTSTVFNSAIRMVGTVAGVFTSYPILYLPIVIGLCGIGIAFYKRMKQ